MTLSEEWRPVVGYEGAYEVSNLGGVRRIGSDKVRALRQHPERYLMLDLWQDGSRETVLAHAVVAAAFIGPRPDGMDVCHANGVRTDNRVENLRYDTRSANNYDTVRHGHHHQAAKSHCKWGHEFDEENTMRYGTRRQCRKCGRLRAARQEGRL